jgi:hypothetical protein
MGVSAGDARAYATDAAHDAAGADLPSRPSNKVLLRIRPPEGIEVDERKCTYMIVDPRAVTAPESAASSPAPRSASRTTVTHPPQS